ncbi:MAG: hypothetical protein JRI97_00790 [Deltaproteobacteria bacterium]|nr:hypothetical protein [Deltaproteobacteria bacterium]
MPIVCADAAAADVYLRADVTTMTMHDGTQVTMWGFAKDSSFGAMDGTVTIPGPRIVVPPGDTVLNIHLDNNLTAAATGLSMGHPVSLVINGLTQKLTPVRHGAAPYPQYEGRIRSFNKEAAPGNASPVTFSWYDVEPGTYLYFSGTHPQFHVQMGLYGAVTKNFAAGQPYEGVFADREALVFYSEIDPLFHSMAASDNYGPGKAMSSTIDYAPKYFLVNGESGTTMNRVWTGAAGSVLIRFVNAGLMPKCPAMQEHYMEVVAEDGFAKNYPEARFSMVLEPLKTKDVIVTTAAPTEIDFYDRRGYVSIQATPSMGTVMLAQ